MFYYKFPFAMSIRLKSRGRVRRVVDFDKDELLTERELREWSKKIYQWETFGALEGFECSCHKVVKIGKRRFAP